MGKGFKRLRPFIILAHLHIFCILRKNFNLRRKYGLLSSFTMSTETHSQENFGSYIDKLFFNSFSNTPDSTILKFLNDFAPILTHPPEATGTGKWVAYSSKDVTIPKVMTHSCFLLGILSLMQYCTGGV
jgi:hypothetical protein